MHPDLLMIQIYVEERLRETEKFARVHRASAELDPLPNRRNRFQPGFSPLRERVWPQRYRQTL